MVVKRPIVNIVGSHVDEWNDLSDPLGEFLASAGCHLMTGAGAGVMTAVAKSFTHTPNRMGSCIGIYPIEGMEDISLPKSKFPNPFIEIHIVVPVTGNAVHDVSPASRNMVDVLSSDIVIALPGLHGTINEVSLALQVGKPLILFGPKDAFKEFPEDAMSVETMGELSIFLKKAIVDINAKKQMKQGDGT